MNRFKTMALGAALIGGLAGEADGSTLTQNEITGFHGIYCKDKENASTLLQAIEEDKMEESKANCVIGRIPVKIIGQVEDKGEWKIHEVEDEDGTRHFIVTTIPFKVAGLDVSYEHLNKEIETEI